ncbi:hypothetical protein BC830DRAFT_1116573 [Chytriomyces sp. MP71]|nr:hypothetical protein BC830DRAFT_1116573 [Chytriomyces sp. MP71]
MLILLLPLLLRSAQENTTYRLAFNCGKITHALTTVMLTDCLSATSSASLTSSTAMATTAKRSLKVDSFVPASQYCLSKNTIIDSSIIEIGDMENA